MKITEKLKPKVVSVGTQVYDMIISFPRFNYYRGSSYSKAGWVGKLKPTEFSPEYTIRIEYNSRYPKVYVLEPIILDKAPHRYEDGSLCLYYPKDKSFDKTSLISKTIIPWTVEWLYFYEAWLEEGVWWGAEAPHLTSPVYDMRLYE